MIKQLKGRVKKVFRKTFLNVVTSPIKIIGEAMANTCASSRGNT